MLQLYPSITLRPRRKWRKWSINYFNKHIKNLLQKSITELNKGDYADASEFVDITYIDNDEYIENPSKEIDKI